MDKLYSTKEIERIIKKDYLPRLYKCIDSQTCIKKNVFYEMGSKDKIEGLYIWTNIYGYNYMQVERGNINEHVITQDFTDILYVVLDHYIFDIACDYELKHRDPQKDFRRLLFEKRKELWKALDEKCYYRCCEDIEKKLQKYPFDDNLVSKRKNIIKFGLEKIFNKLK